MSTNYFLTFLMLVGLTLPNFAQNTDNVQIEVVTQEKIQGIITLLVYSPDGSLIASGSEKENSIKVWDVNSGKIIGKLEGHSEATTALHFNSDGSTLISAANDNKVMLWNLNTWKLIDSTSTPSPIQSFVVSADETTSFYSGAEDGTIQKWTANNFQNPEKIHSHTASVVAIDIHKNILATGDLNGNLTVFDLTAKQNLITSKIQLSGIKGLNFYNEGKNLITAGFNGKVNLWQAETLSESKHFFASKLAITAYDANVNASIFVTANQSTIKVWNFEGSLLYEFKSKSSIDGDKEPVKALRISPDGTTMASSGFQKSPTRKTAENKNLIRIWDLKRGALYKALEGTVNPIYSFDFHPTKNELITLGDDNQLVFWNFNLAEKKGALALHEPKRELATLRNPLAKGNGELDRGDLQRGKRFKSMIEKAAKGDFSGVREETKEKGKDFGVGYAKSMFKERTIVKYSEQGTYIITKQKNDEIRMYGFNAENQPTYLQSIYSYQPSINQLLTSPDEQYLAVLGAGDSAISIIDLESKKFITKLPTSAPQDNFRFVYEANSLAFSPDGSLLAVCFNTGKTFVFNTGSWSLAFQNVLPDNLGYVKSPFVNFSKDGKYMVVKSMLGLKKYDTKEFNIFGSEPLKVDGYSAPMDKPQDYAITIKDDYIYFENLFTGEVQKSIHVSPDQITHISINPKGLVGVTFSSGQFQLLNPETGEEEILLVAQNDNYIFKTPENFYKVSKEGRNLVTFRIGNQAFPFEQFDAIFNRPDLVLKKMGCTDNELMTLYEKAYKKRIKKLGLQPTTEIVLADIPKTKINNAADIPAITEDGSIAISLTMNDANALKSYNIWVNNVPIHGKKGKSINGTAQTIDQNVDLIYGMNKIQIACRNKNGYESLIQTFYVEKEGAQPERDLYVLAIGTSKYKDGQYDLSYPVKDGADLLALMRSNEKGIYNKIIADSLFDTDVTIENIAKKRDFLMKSKPNDVVMVFVAGHGVLDANFDYYFGTHNIDFNNPAIKGLAYEKLERILDGIKANKKILIMDTCHSGEVDKEDVIYANNDVQEEEEDISFRAVGAALATDKSKATPSRLAGELFNDLRKGTGATVISSAGGVEFAMESDEWKNGLFTYCMLKGLSTRNADLNDDGKIMLLELQTYVVDLVTQLSHKRQIPNTRIQNIELDFQVW